MPAKPGFNWHRATERAIHLAFSLPTRYDLLLIQKPAMKNKLQILLACIAAAAVCGPLTAFAATKKSSSSAAKPISSPAISPSPAAKATPSPIPSAPTTRPISFHGMISAVDQKAKTFTIAGKQASRVFKVTERTFLSKAGMPATMKDVVVNEEARGSYWKAADGTLEAKKIKLGPMTEAEKARAEKKKSPKPDVSPSPSPSASASSAPSPSASARP